MHVLLRFGLGTLLFLTACVAGCFGGYRAGYDRGAAAYQAMQITVEEYYIADLVTIHPRQEDIDFVTQTLRETVGEGSDWVNASIEFDPEHLSLLVTHNQACHREIKAFLRTLRMGRSLNDPNSYGGDASSPQKMVLLDIKGLLAQPGQKKPGFEWPGIQAALQAAAPKAQFWGATEDEQIRVYGNFAEVHQMNTVLKAMRELKYIDRFQVSSGPDETAYLHDFHTRKTWTQKQGAEMWTLHHSR